MGPCAVIPALPVATRVPPPHSARMSSSRNTRPSRTARPLMSVTACGISRRRSEPSASVTEPVARGASSEPPTVTSGRRRRPARPAQERRNARRSGRPRLGPPSGSSGRRVLRDHLAAARAWAVEHDRRAVRVDLERPADRDPVDDEAWWAEPQRSRAARAAGRPSIVRRASVPCRHRRVARQRAAPASMRSCPPARARRRSTADGPRRGTAAGARRQVKVPPAMSAWTSATVMRSPWARPRRRSEIGPRPRRSPGRRGRRSRPRSAASGARRPG